MDQIRVPLVAPYALDVLASTLCASGQDVEVLDLNLAADPAQAIDEYFRRSSPDLVALTMRNTGDLFFPILDLPNAGPCLPDNARLVGSWSRHVTA